MWHLLRNLKHCSSRGHSAIANLLRYCMLAGDESAIE